MTDLSARDNNRRIATAVRDACVRATRQGYENAAASGLCDEGAIEAAIGAIQMIDLAAVLDETDPVGD